MDYKISERCCSAQILKDCKDEQVNISKVTDCAAVSQKHADT